MSETTLEIIKLVFSFLGSTVGTFIGFLSGVKLRDYRISQLEKKQTTFAEKQREDENEISEVKITITAMNGKIESHEERIKKGEKKLEQLEEFHMKKE